MYLLSLRDRSCKVKLQFHPVTGTDTQPTSHSPSLTMLGPWQQNDNDNNNCIGKLSSRFFQSSHCNANCLQHVCLYSRVSDQNGVSLLYIMLEIHHSVRKPSIWSRHNCVQIMCNISSAYHMQHMCHMVRSDGSVIKFDIV